MAASDVVMQYESDLTLTLDLDLCMYLILEL